MLQCGKVKKEEKTHSSIETKITVSRDKIREIRSDCCRYRCCCCCCCWLVFFAFISFRLMFCLFFFLVAIKFAFDCRSALGCGSFAIGSHTHIHLFATNYCCCSSSVFPIRVRSHHLLATAIMFALTTVLLFFMCFFVICFDRFFILWCLMSFELVFLL